MPKVGNTISKTDTLTLLEIIYQCSSCTSILDALSIINKTNTLLDFNHAIFGLAKLNQDGSIGHYDTLNFSFPEEWLGIYKKSKFHEIDPIAIENFSNFDLQYWADTYKKYTVDNGFISMSEEFNLINGYACGTINHSKTDGSLLSLAGNIRKHPRNIYILINLSSHLHVAFNNVLHRQCNAATPLRITAREKEILNWVKHGKSTWDISVILNISERTVKFHVKNIMLKLDAVSRSHAVAIALSEGLIDFV